MTSEMKTEIGKFFRDLLEYAQNSDDNIRWPKGVRFITPEQQRTIDPKRTRRFRALSERGMLARSVKPNKLKTIRIKSA